MRENCGWGNRGNKGWKSNKSDGKIRVREVGGMRAGDVEEESGNEGR